MKKLFEQIALVFSLLFFGCANAQPVIYSLKDGNSNQPLGQMTLNYTFGGGYEAVMNGGQRASVEVHRNTAIVTMGQLIVTMQQIDGSYYHNRVGQWRIAPVTTSLGNKGVAKMFYAGPTPEDGRLYYEELWLEGELVSWSKTVVDNTDQIVWSVFTDAEGTLRISRL